MFLDEDMGIYSLDAYTPGNQTHIPDIIQINPRRRPDETPSNTDPQFRPQDLILGFPKPCACRIRQRLLHS